MYFFTPSENKDFNDEKLHRPLYKRRYFDVRIFV